MGQLSGFSSVALPEQMQAFAPAAAPQPQPEQRRKTIADHFTGSARNAARECYYPALRYRPVRFDRDTPEDPDLNPDCLFTIYKPRFSNRFGSLIPIMHDKEGDAPENFPYMDRVEITGHKRSRNEDYDFVTLSINGWNRDENGYPYRMLWSASDGVVEKYGRAFVQTDLLYLDPDDSCEPVPSKHIFVIATDRVRVRECRGSIITDILDASPPGAEMCPRQSY